MTSTPWRSGGSTLGRFVYYDVLEEPFRGETRRVRIGGGEPETIARGASPALSPSGSTVATVDRPGPSKVIITDLSNGDRTTIDLKEGVITHPTWSPDGRALIVERTNDDGTSDLVVIDPFRDDDNWFPIAQPEGTSRTLPVWFSTENIYAVEQCCTMQSYRGPATLVKIDPATGESEVVSETSPVLHMDTDGDGGNLVVVTRDGRLQWLDDEGEFQPLDATGYTAADW